MAGIIVGALDTDVKTGFVLIAEGGGSGGAKFPDHSDKKQCGQNQHGGL